VDHGDYGVVMITAGPKAGKLGYYDEDLREGAIVYVDGPAFFSSYDVIPHSALGSATEAEARWWEATKNNEKAVEKAASNIKRRHQRRRRMEAPVVNTAPMFDADIAVVIRDGTNDTHMKCRCRLPFAPHVGMSLFVGDRRGEGEYVDVENVTFYVEDRAFDIDASVPQKEWQSLENGKFRLVKQSEYIDRLKAAGFEIEYQFPATRKKRKGRARGAQSGTPRPRRKGAVRA
jgi:hypothetical protein